MSYVDPNYKTKKAFLDALAKGTMHQTYNPSGMFPTKQDGTDCIEGPHYPAPHKWYAAVTVQNGIVVSSGRVKLGSAKAVIAAAKADTSTLSARDTAEHHAATVDAWVEHAAPAVPAPISYAPEVIADSSEKFCGNGLRFATEAEAKQYVIDLMMRWTAVCDYRVAPSQDAVTHRIVDGVMSRIDGD